MSADRKPLITLGVDAGGKDADDATRQHYMNLRRLLAAECTGPYGLAFDEIALVLRIDGSVQSWKKRGVENVRLQRKSRYATADVFVSADVWRNQSAHVLKEYIATEVASAVRAIAERAKASKDDLDADRLLADTATAMGRFLAQ